MADILCGYTADRDEILIAFLYGEIDRGPHAAFEAHLATCERCRHELAELQGVRANLQAWTPPAAVLPDGGGSPFASPAPRRGAAWLREMPMWAQAAAALLILGVSAGIANVNVHYDQSGLTIRTGWSSAPASAGPRPSDAQAPATAAPWRADLEALEQRLRTDAPAAPVRIQDAADSSDAQVLRRVRALIQESERKQLNEIALRIGEIARDFDTKRGSDLANIDRSMRTFQSNTGIEVARYGQMVNYLANRVSLQK